MHPWSPPTPVQPLIGTTVKLRRSPSRRTVTGSGVPTLRPMMPTSCDGRTTGSSLIAMMTSPGLMPALSAGSPGVTFGTLGCASGQTPMSPISYLFSGADTGVTCLASSRPSRSSVIVTSRFGREATARKN